MKGLTSYKITTRIRLKSIADSKKVDESFIKHYTFILEHFDDIIAVHDKEIAKIEEEKAEVLKQFIEAPQQLKELNQHLAELAKKRRNVTDADGKVKRVKHLRDRLAALIQECEQDGINIDEVKENIEKLREEGFVEKAPKRADEIAAEEAVGLV